MLSNIVRSGGTDPWENTCLACRREYVCPRICEKSTCRKSNMTEVQGTKAPNDSSGPVWSAPGMGHKEWPDPIKLIIMSGHGLSHGGLFDT